MQLRISPRSIGKVNNYFENTQHFQTFFFKDDKFIGNVLETKRLTTVLFSESIVSRNRSLGQSLSNYIYLIIPKNDREAQNTPLRYNQTQYSGLPVMQK